MVLGNYCAFYVKEPFTPSNLKALIAKDFCYYNTLKMWKGQDSKFPFTDSHDTTYSVRDDSDWEETLKPRLRKRLKNSKNIILFLSSNTANSCALREEIDYGVNTLELPVIVIYPEYSAEGDLLTPNKEDLKQAVKNLWDKLPIFRDSMGSVPTLHIPMNKNSILKALSDNDFKKGTTKEAKIWLYKE